MLMLRILWVIVLTVVLGLTLWLAWSVGGVLTGLIVTLMVIPALVVGFRSGRS